MVKLRRRPKKADRPRSATAKDKLKQREGELVGRLQRLNAELERRSGDVRDPDGPHYQALLSVRHRRDGVVAELQELRRVMEEHALQEVEGDLLKTEKGERVRASLDRLVAAQRSYGSALMQSFSTIETAAREALREKEEVWRAADELEKLKRGLSQQELEVVKRWEEGMDLAGLSGQRGKARSLLEQFILNVVAAELWPSAPADALQERIKRG